MEVVVCPLSAVEHAVAAHGATCLISLMSEPEMIPRPAAIDPARHLRLVVNDIVAPADGLISPAIGHAQALVRFAADWDRARPLVIHCYAGISRSTAAALIVLCAVAPAADEIALARALRAASPTAAPNRLLLTHGDAALGRGGRLVAALDAIGDAVLAAEGAVFRLPLPDAGPR